MNQIMFDIKALTDFFIDQNEIPVVQNAGASSDFNSILTTSIINDKIKQERLCKAEIDIVYSILSNIPAFAINTDVIPNLSFHNFLMNENLIFDTATQSEQESINFPQIESLTPESIAVSDLKNLIEAQAIPLTLSLNKAKADIIDSANSNRLPNAINAETKDIQSSLLGNQSQENVSPDGALLTSDTIKESMIRTANSGNVLLTDDSKGNAIKPSMAQSANSGTASENIVQYSKIIFTVDQLLDDSQDEVPVKVIDDNNNVSDMKVSLSKLEELVKNYPDKIIVEVKASRMTTDIGGINKSQTVMPFISDAGSNTELGKPSSGKFFIFNLNSLLSHDGSEKINVVQKTLSDNPQAYTSIKNQLPYLPETRFLTNINHEIKSITINHTASTAANESSVINQKQEMPSSASNSPPENAKSSSQENAVKQTLQEHLTVKDDNLKNINELGFKSKNNQQVSSYDKDKTNRLVSGNNDTKNQHEVKTSAASEQSLSSDKAPIQSSQASNMQTQSSQIQDIQHQVSQIQSAQRSIVQSEIPATENHIAAKHADAAENIINQLKSRMIVARENTRMTIQLKPESLGKILIDFKYDGHKLEVLFRVENLDVKQALDLEMPKLKADWKIDDFRVVLNNSEQQPDLNAKNQHSSGMANQKSSPDNNSVNNTINADNDVSPIERNSGNPANVYGGVIDIVA